MNEMSIDDNVLAEVKSRYNQARSAGAVAAVQSVSEHDIRCWSDLEELATDALVEHGFPAHMRLMIRCRPQESGQETLLRFISGRTALPEIEGSEEYDLALEFHTMFLEDMMNEMETLGVSGTQLSTLINGRIRAYQLGWDSDVMLAPILEEVGKSIAAAGKARVDPT